MCVYNNHVYREHVLAKRILFALHRPLRFAFIIAQVSTNAPTAATPMYPENQYPQNPYSYPSERYGSTPMDQGAPPYSGTETQYPAPQQPPSQYPPYGQ